MRQKKNQLIPFWQEKYIDYLIKAREQARRKVWLISQKIISDIRDDASQSLDKWKPDKWTTICGSLNLKTGARISGQKNKPLKRRLIIPKIEQQQN